MLQRTQRIVNYLQACFAWEYSNLGGQNLLSNSLRNRYFSTLETVFSGLSDVPHIPAKQSAKLLDTLEKNTRSSDLWYGVFPLQARLSSSGFQGKNMCAPLFIADLGIQHLRQRRVNRPPLYVNRLALSRLLDSDEADQLANALQKIINTGPLGKTQIREVLTILSQKIANLTALGFELYPLLSSNAGLSTTPKENCPVLTCAGAVYISRRSRQSMGVLHELGKLKQYTRFSTPLVHLVDGAAHSVNTAGPLNVIGALSAPQRKAIEAARQHSLSVVHGPPGTGKTHVLAMLVADQLANGQSVLVCTRSNAAMDVIEQVVRKKLHIEEAAVRGGSAEHLRQLRLRLQQIVHQGAIGFSHPQAEVTRLLGDSNGDIASLKRALAKVSKQLAQLDKQLVLLARKLGTHVKAGEGNPSFSYRVTSLLRSTFGKELPPLFVARLVEQWRTLLKRRESAVIAKLQIRIQLNVATVLLKQRGELSRLARSVTAREQKQRQLQEAMNYDVMTQTFPLWMSSLSDLSHILPLKHELFDVLIIDEASQADIASALPALFRSKRAIIIGDAQQLRHVSFLPNQKERDLLNDSSLSVNDSPSFRNDSILDWVNRHIETSEASSFLDEHFRSAPPIIEFSNREFYGNQLKLLTHIQQYSRPPVQLVELEHAKRDAKTGANPSEAQAVVDYLGKMLSADSGSTPISQEVDSRISVGVVSPFRAQVDLLEKLVTNELSAEVRKAANLIVGTAHELQGEERDVILFSSCVDDESSGGSLTFLSRADVLNVSVTRARQQQAVFLSRAASRFDSSTLFGRYIEHVRHAASQPNLVEAGDTKHQKGVRAIANDLAVLPCEVLTNVQIGSVRVDVLLSTDTHYLGIDLIGLGSEEARYGLHRHELELFYRLNVPIVPVTEKDWRESKASVVAYLEEQLGLDGETAT